MISRHIGYQAKNAKHSTAPMRNPCADALRLALRPRLTAARDRTRPGTGLASRKVATMGASCRDSRPAGPGGVRAGRPGSGVCYPPLLARIWLTWLVAVVRS